MHFTCRSFIGKPSGNNWSQYWENEPDDQNLVVQKGHLFGLINLSFENQEEDISTIGHDIIFELNQSYFSEESDNISQCLKLTISSVVNNPLYADKNIELILAIVLGPHLYLASYKSGFVIVSRNQQISIILENHLDQIKTVDGPIIPEDKIVLSTDAFYQTFGWEKIKAFLSTDKIQTIEENTLAALYSIEDQTGLAAALIQVHYDEVESTPDIISAPQLDLQLEPTSPTTSISPPSISFSKKILSILDNKNNKSVYVSHSDTNQTSIRKKIHLVVACLLIIGLALSSYFGYHKNKEVKSEKQYQAYKTELDDKISNIAAVKNINLNTAQQLAQESQTIIQKMADLKIHSQDLEHYQVQIQQTLSQTGSSQSFSPELFIDTSATFKNAKQNQMVIRSGQIYLLDGPNGRINNIDISKKIGKTFYSNNLIKDTKFIVENSDNLYLAGTDQIYLVSKNSMDAKIDLTKQPSTISPDDIYFWNGAAYVLDSLNSKVWKFNSTATGFGSAQNWIKNEQKISSNATSFTIDGNIWILEANGQISSYTSGVKQNFQVSQGDDITDAGNLSTTPDAAVLAFSDNGQYIYLYKKTGELQAKYNLDKIKIIDIALDDQNKLIFVLSDDQKIYRINY